MLKDRPDDFDALIATAKLYTELNEHDKAAEFYRSASNIKQDDGEVFVRLVEAQVKLIVVPSRPAPSHSGPVNLTSRYKFLCFLPLGVKSLGCLSTSTSPHLTTTSPS